LELRPFVRVGGFGSPTTPTDGQGRAGGSCEFLNARVSRLPPPYLMATVATAAISLLAAWMLSRGYLRSSATAQMNPLGQSLKFYLATLTLTQLPLGQVPIVEVCWTLCYEIAFYGIVFIALLLCRLAGLGARQMLNGLHAVTIAS